MKEDKTQIYSRKRTAAFSCPFLHSFHLYFSMSAWQYHEEYLCYSAAKVIGSESVMVS